METQRESVEMITGVVPTIAPMPLPLQPSILVVFAYLAVFIDLNASGYMLVNTKRPRIPYSLGLI